MENTFVTEAQEAIVVSAEEKELHESVEVDETEMTPGDEEEHEGEELHEEEEELHEDESDEEAA